MVSKNMFRFKLVLEDWPDDTFRFKTIDQLTTVFSVINKICVDASGLQCLFKSPRIML